MQSVVCSVKTATRISKYLKRLSETQKAYLAGIIDGEGCIALTSSYNRKTRKLRENFRPMVSVETTSKELNDFLFDVTGQGKIYRSFPPGNRRQRYTWLLGGKQVIREFLEVIKPYCVIKKKHVETMLDYIGQEELHYGYWCISRHLEAHRKYKQIFSKLNMKGKGNNIEFREQKQ